MKNRLFQRMSMLVAGLVAAAVILLSQSYYQGTVEVAAKAKTEQAADKDAQAFISAPSDLLPGSSSVQVESNTSAFISIVSLPEIEIDFAPVVAEVTSSFFKTLFRTVIASQAP